MTTAIIYAEKVLDRIAYPRNGNVHNPTKYYKWVGFVNGRRVTSPMRTKREALEVAREAAKEI